MEIKEIQQEIVEEFSMFDDWMQRYEYMIELGKSLPLINEKYKTDDNIIKGCQSRVWEVAALSRYTNGLPLTSRFKMGKSFRIFCTSIIVVSIAYKDTE